MKIRRFRNGDEVALFNVFLSSVRDLASRDYTPEQIEAWAAEDRDRQQWASHMRSLQPFIVEIADEIAGYADVQLNGDIDHFFVSGHYAKQGVGTALMLAIEDEAKHRGLNTLSANVSKTAEPFFIRHGFYLVERGFPVRRGVILHNALMRKDVGKVGQEDN